MLRKSTLAAVSALALVAACGQPAQTTQNDPALDTPPAMPEVAQVTNADFAARVAAADAYEIQAAEIAAERGVRAEVKSFAAQMRTDHTATTQELTSLAPQVGVTALTPTLTSDHQTRLDALRNSSAEGFDDLYLDQQVEAHENAVRMFQEFAERGEAGPLRDWAQTTLPKLQAHLTSVQALENAT